MQRIPGNRKAIWWIWQQRCGSERQVAGHENGKRIYNEQNNTVNVLHYDTNCIVSLDCGKWESGLRTTQNSQGRMDALTIDDPVEYVRLMLSGEMQVWLDALDDMSVW